MEASEKEKQEIIHKRQPFNFGIKELKRVLDRMDMPKEEKVNAEQKINSVQAQAVKDLAENTNTEVKELCKYYQVKSLDDLTLAQWSHAVKVLEKKRG